ncbi:MAG: HlyC/CorC family transporter [Lachnospiraceae bacterium]|nr:HlyC/CorC family transporter [Lachnospiraceae bacterium]MBR4058886.1 HlyC/CorC family transporter [Lachnospiraceae bacterium]
MILLQVVLIALNAVFACAEIAIISMNDTKLAKMAQEGDKRAVRLARLTSEPARFLATIQVAITLSGFLGSAFAAENFSGVLVDWVLSLGVPISAEVLDSVAVILITIVLSYFTLVFGELVPKQVAMRKAEPLALAMSGLISSIAKFFKPIVSFLTFSTNSILRLMGIDPNAEDDEVSEEEIRMMVDVGSEKGTIDITEKEFIQNVFEFDDLSAEEIVTRRTEVVLLDLEDSMEEWKEIIYNTRHTLYPVCEGSADKIIGILNAQEYFRLDDRSRENVLKEAVAPAYFVPNMVKADTLFRNMKKEKQKMAVVLNEYGGMTGIITINDLVEQLVGDLGYDNEDEGIELIGENTWKVHGSALLEDVSEAIGVPLTCEDYDTFNGLVFHELGSVPEDGADIELEVNGLVIQVTEIKKHQVESAIVTLKKI